MFFIKTIFYRIYIKILKLVVHLIPMNMPVLFSGQGSHIQLVRMIKQMGANKVILVTDQGLTQIGLYNAMVAELEKLGVSVFVYDQITPDPTDDQVNEGFRLVKEQQCDAVIGFGGGSSMDAAKLISVLPVVNKPLEKLTGILKITQRGLPLFLVPTTAGTGSEVTIAAVVTDKNTGQKMPAADPVLIPTAAALDPELMLGLPPKVTAATGFDAFTHAVEAFISTNATKETDKFAKTAAKLIWDNLPVCIETPKDIAARESMALASYYAGIAFSKAGLGYTHGIAHQLGAFYHVPHGEANALVLPHILEFSYPNAIPRLAELGRHVGIAGNSDAEVAKTFVDEVFALRQTVGLPGTLPAIKKEDYSVICRNALKESHSFYAVPRYMTPQQCAGILDSLASN